MSLPDYYRRKWRSERIVHFIAAGGCAMPACNAWRRVLANVPYADPDYAAMARERKLAP